MLSSCADAAAAPSGGLCRLLAAAALLLSAISSGARADFIDISVQNQPCRVSGEWKWSFPSAEADITVGGPWFVSVQTTDTGGNTANVKVKIQHDPGNPACHDDGTHGPNALALQMERQLVRRAKGAAVVEVAAQVTHRDKDGPAHRDAGEFSAAVDALGFPRMPGEPNAFISVSAQHLGSPVPVTPSFKNFLDRPVKVRVTPDYRAPLTNDIFPFGGAEYTIPPGGSLPPEAKLEAKSPSGAALASLKVEYAASPLSSTELAFLGTVDGAFTELDLDAGIALFGDILAPGLNNDAVPLFIGVDLTRWQSHPTAFEAGDIFTIDDGLSDLLPGFLVGTSPVTLGPDGYVTDHPFTGQVFVGAAIDGHLAPAPGTLALLASGVMGWLVCALRRRARRPAYVLADARSMVPM